MIFKYPDGSYSYAFKCCQNDMTKIGIDNGLKDYQARDSWLQIKCNMPSSNYDEMDRI